MKKIEEIKSKKELLLLYFLKYYSSKEILLTMYEIIEWTKISRPTLEKHFENLIKNNCIEKTKKGKNFLYKYNKNCEYETSNINITNIILFQTASGDISLQAFKIYVLMKKYVLQNNFLIKEKNVYSLFKCNKKILEELLNKKCIVEYKNQYETYFDVL